MSNEINKLPDLFYKGDYTPNYAEEFSAGIDLIAKSFEIIGDGVVKFNTEIAFEIPEYHYGVLAIRSGLASKGKWLLANGLGVIDSSYRNTIGALFKYVGSDLHLELSQASLAEITLDIFQRVFGQESKFNPEDFIKEFLTKRANELIGKKICQLIITPYAKCNIQKKEELSETKRGLGGFGSTGE